MLDGVMKRRGLACVAFSLALALQAGASRGDETPAAQAERLFNEGNRLADRGDFSGACSRYEASTRLDPAIGTQFNLADCNEHLGRLATALALFRSVENVAKLAGKTERQSSARARADALEKTVPRLRVTLSKEASVPGVEVACDDKALAAEDLGRALPFDPGSHSVTARAPGRQAWVRRVDLPVGQGVDVVVPELVAVFAQLSSAPASPPDRPRIGPWQTLGIGAAAAGVAGIAVGAIAGIGAVNRTNALKTACGGSLGHCGQVAGSEDDAVAAARSWATASTVGFVAGGALLATGAAIYLWGPRSPLGSFTVAPSAIGSGAGTTLVGVW